MKVSREEVEYIAKLANLKFSSNEMDKLLKEFESILEHFENLDQEDLKGYDMYSFEEKSLRTREDKVVDFENKSELFSNVKKMRDKFIEIPKVVD
ncbi:MAG TPA: Asp-tRNA(Asn)/Glu-tRNA(Gln) amidotransferase GatCAB subunit C [Clostridiales bacterium]|jgi:aspartyl-tRNA(Asn)/glutamyl-tRNA(Gln) amidotransferase subunit C|nr:Asp-tRNA(Asn)/Glu-tRNA(Gln) amidotransferase GatCAB subunit C [Clostridiales bacterium]